ncbi:MAG: cytochrome c biogenesis protein CcsA [Pirellulales bacterium]|nr:cytochrome c biogenesis protein CcsA [Pirellulales bacterium]
MSGVGIICFAASYSVSLALEVSRLLFRSGVRGALMMGFAGAGLFAHTAFLVNRAATAKGSPLSSEQDWYLLAAWVLAVVYLYLTYYHPRTAFGLFLLPLVLALIAAARFFADSQPFAREPASQAWGIIHGTSILLAVVSVSIGFAAGSMYLSQVWRLKQKRAATGRLRLPSLEWLQRANSRAIIISLLMLGAGVVSGVVLNLINEPRETGSLPWTDPVVLSTGLMFAWQLAAVLTGALYKPARQGRKVAFFTVISFVFLVIVLGVILLFDSEHGGRRNRGGRGSGFGIEGQGFGNRDFGLRTTVYHRNVEEKGGCSTLGDGPGLRAAEKRLSPLALDADSRSFPLESIRGPLVSTHCPRLVARRWLRSAPLLHGGAA